MQQLELDFGIYHQAKPRFETISLAEAGLEDSGDHAHGYHESVSGSVYDYTNWFYDGDESAFSVI